MDTTDISDLVWRSKYRSERIPEAPEDNIDATWRRVCHAVATPEKSPGDWEDRFLALLADFRFLPGGRILAGAGVDRQITLFNCFVSGPLVDSVDGILESLRETAVTMQQGGGIGIDFSGLRPSGSPAHRTGAVASGPVSFMHVWDTLCETLLATSSRRGAMMGTLRCDHPDIEAFIDAKRDPGVLRNFNLSVLVTDAFMKAVADDAAWTLAYPQGGEPFIERSLPARKLWLHMVETSLETAEPGLLFVDTINRDNNLYYCESISATNPCGEVPLPAYGACNLGSVNLAQCVESPFSDAGSIDYERVREVTATAVRFLDNVIDASRFPLDRQAQQARRTRRIGIGLTGLADALAMLGLHYDSDKARGVAIEVLRHMRDSAYHTSTELAREKGAFPAFDSERYLAAAFIRRLPRGLREAIAEHGIRNSHLLSIAPAGTISLLAGNVSSGIEPIYALHASRSIRDADLQTRDVVVEDHAYRMWQAQAGSDAALPDSFVTADALPARAHLAMQTALQPYVDNAISKTITLAPKANIADVEAVFRKAHAEGIKGCTVFRPGTERGQVIRARDESHCCSLDREGD